MNWCCYKHSAEFEPIFQLMAGETYICIAMCRICCKRCAHNRGNSVGVVRSQRMCFHFTGNHKNKTQLFRPNSEILGSSGKSDKPYHSWGCCFSGLVVRVFPYCVQKKLVILCYVGFFSAKEDSIALDCLACCVKCLERNLSSVFWIQQGSLPVKGFWLRLTISLSCLSVTLCPGLVSCESMFCLGLCIWRENS